MALFLIWPCLVREKVGIFFGLGSVFCEMWHGLLLKKIGNFLGTKHGPLNIVEMSWRMCFNLPEFLLRQKKKKLT